jgi:hypothetical protein
MKLDIYQTQRRTIAFPYSFCCLDHNKIFSSVLDTQASLTYTSLTKKVVLVSDF